MANATSFQVEQKPRKRRLSARQKASSLFHLWHSIQDMKAEAEDMKDGELVLLMGMGELLVEGRRASAERTARRFPAPIRPGRTRFQSEGKPGRLKRHGFLVYQSVAAAQPLGLGARIGRRRHPAHP